eukprot:CAMPEP_0118921752 /NCGR_PEP_ID=MMETSP1169-20130426/928_1 /TAXON_ID=36882 /ORGANISM="Pyramimonas obovata, Strain CCMP722" /LENGTH=677 /DNA_ID=CAMNT_0006862529 /DNA_START=333 /DNA_END=2363 /DNA_ORIENTATION=+
MGPSPDGGTNGVHKEAGNGIAKVEDSLGTAGVKLEMNGEHAGRGIDSSGFKERDARDDVSENRLDASSSTQSLTALIRRASTTSSLDNVSGVDSTVQLRRSNTAKDYEHAKFTFTQSVALNTLNMFGTGPFITLPLLISATDPAGPHSLIGYSIAGLVSMFDSTIWGELGSLMPYSGATYIYLREAYGRESWGRLMSFMFIWQFLLSGPLEIASGFIAMAQYLGYIFEMNFWQTAILGCGFCVGSVAILHGDITLVSKWTVGLWLVTIAAIGSTLIFGFANFDAGNLNTPDDAFKNVGRLVVSLGLSARIGLYDFSGYQDVCMIGDEVQDAKRNIPKSCVITCVVVTVVYLAVYLAVLGYLPWDGADGFVQMMDDHGDTGNYIMSIFYERLAGRGVGIVFTLVVVITIFGSCFSLLLGYSQVPYSSAKDGSFFRWFGHEHPTKKGLADYSLLTLGVVSAACCFIDLEDLINSMLIPRLVLLYLTQTVGLVVLRSKKGFGDRTDVYRCPWYPLPVIVNIIGFSYCFVTSDNWFISGNKPLMDISILYCLLGVVVYILWARHRKFWPYVAGDGEMMEGMAKGNADSSVASNLHLRTFNARMVNSPSLMDNMQGNEVFDDKSARSSHSADERPGKPGGIVTFQEEMDAKRHNDPAVEVDVKRAAEVDVKKAVAMGEIQVE